jgi:methionyl-tRNA synthetase
VPEPGALGQADEDLIKSADAVLDQVGEYISKCSFKQAIMAAMAATRQANRYLDERAPWKVIKEDRQAAADSLYTITSVISRLKTMLSPFLPFSSQKVHEYLGFPGYVQDAGWRPQTPPPGQPLREPRPLFTKLDDGIIEEETKRIGT